ncbi:MAG: hypothetical protein HYU75_13740 [Betaproteobacteria bacterium]|nr:hypothetical protein [Betaproteobacteria bacterium]
MIGHLDRDDVELLADGVVHLLRLDRRVVGRGEVGDFDPLRLQHLDERRVHGADVGILNRRGEQRDALALHLRLSGGCNCQRRRENGENGKYTHGSLLSV